MKQKCAIYILIDPETNKVRYVGRSVNPERRLGMHQNFPTNAAMQMWLQNLKAKNLLPIIETVEVTTRPKKQEAFWIRYYMRSPLGQLLNVQDTGQKRGKWRKVSVHITQDEYNVLVAKAGEQEFSTFIRNVVLRAIH